MYDTCNQLVAKTGNDNLTLHSISKKGPASLQVMATQSRSTAYFKGKGIQLNPALSVIFSILSTLSTVSYDFLLVNLPLHSFTYPSFDFLADNYLKYL